MVDPHALVARLRARGIRVTPQRAMILQAIETLPGHMTAEEVYSAVQRHSPYVNLATVYRTLDLLRSLDLVTVANMGTGATHFALHTHATHHHAICRACGHSLEFPPTLLDSLMQSLEGQYGFVAAANHIVIFGWCSACRASGADVAGAPMA
ncbi:MAG: Fur family transcriptional regulator [Caldilineaceae bacterium]